MFLMFGRFGGCDTVYNDLKPSGARVIELTEGEPGFRSWIRIYGEGITQDLNYPEDFKTCLLYTSHKRPVAALTVISNIIQSD